MFVPVLLFTVTLSGPEGGEGGASAAKAPPPRPVLEKIRTLVCRFWTLWRHQLWKRLAGNKPLVVRWNACCSVSQKW